jgi:hypothetical protein
VRDAQGRVCPRVRSWGGRNGKWQGWKEACAVFPKKGEEEEKRGGVSQGTRGFFICYVNRIQRKPTNKGMFAPFRACFCCSENNT